MRFFLGVDGGGSKCDAVLIDEQGTVLGWGRSGATSYQPDHNAAAATAQALAGALGSLAITRVRTGFTWGGLYIVEWLSDRGIQLVSNTATREWDNTFLAADREWGIAVHAGTGSWVQARTPDGREVHVGGMGPFLGDEGGGWDIGFRGIKAALRSGWTKHTRTTLAEAVPLALGVSSLQQATVGQPIVNGQVTRAQIASVAPVVITHAAAGDRIAMSILNESANSLADICALVLDELAIIGEGYPLIGMAGVIQNSPLYWQILTAGILRYDSSLVPEVVPMKMAVAAAMQAMRAADVQITPQLRARILHTQDAFPAARIST